MQRPVNVTGKVMNEQWAFTSVNSMRTGLCIVVLS
jgi:hypothetical protein